MTREDLEHIIRASADVTNQYEFIIVGSQSILGSVPNPEEVFTMSAEADIYPLQAPELAEKIDGAIGEGSKFHETNGYYAQGVGPDTAILPSGWLQRVHRVQNSNTNDRVGYCLDVADLFASKAAAGRDKDRKFCMALLTHAYVTPTPGSGSSAPHAYQRRREAQAPRNHSPLGQYSTQGRLSHPRRVNWAAYGLPVLCRGPVENECASPLNATGERRGPIGTPQCSDRTSAKRCRHLSC